MFGESKGMILLGSILGGFHFYQPLQLALAHTALCGGCPSCEPVVARLELRRQLEYDEARFHAYVDGTAGDRTCGANGQKYAQSFVGLVESEPVAAKPYQIAGRKPSVGPRFDGFQADDIGQWWNASVALDA